MFLLNYPLADAVLEPLIGEAKPAFLNAQTHSMCPCTRVKVDNLSRIIISRRFEFLSEWVMHSTLDCLDLRPKQRACWTCVSAVSHCGLPNSRQRKHVSVTAGPARPKTQKGPSPLQ
jgi:hypothetical protein